MIKRMVAFFILTSVLIGTFPAVASNDDDILFSESFTQYGENSQAIDTLEMVSGIDTRVITDENDKVLFSRAFGKKILLKASFSDVSDKYTVLSADIKFTGAITTGKLFTVEFPDNAITFFTLFPDASLRLPDGKLFGGMARGTYQNIALVINWEDKLFDAYLNDKCIVSDWDFSDYIYNGPAKSVQWQVDYNGEDETDFYIDNIFIYNSNKVLENEFFPKESATDAAEEFIPTTEIDTSSEILADLEFNDSKLGVSLNGGNTITAKTDDDGVGYAHLYADEQTKSSAYFDIINEQMSSCSQYVVDIRLKINELKGNAKLSLFDSKDRDGGSWRMGYDVTSTGKITSAVNSSVVGIPNAGQWTRMSVVYNIDKGTADVYINGEYNTSHSVTATFYPTIFRIDLINPLGSKHDTMIDWIRIYTGDELLDDEYFGQRLSSLSPVNPDATQVVDNPIKLQEALDGRTIFMPSNSTMCINGEKQPCNDFRYAPLNLNGVMMIPIDALKLFADEEITYTPELGTVTFSSGAVLKVNSSLYTQHGKESELAASLAEKNGILYLPLRDVCEKILGKFVAWDNRGFVVISDTPIEVTSDYHYLDRFKQFYPIDLIYRYMQFDNPTGTEIIEAVKSNFPGKSHPRIWYTYQDADYILSHISSDNTWKKAFDAELAIADANLKRDYSGYYNADDANKQNAAYDSQAVMESLVTAYMLTGKTVYAEKGVEMLKGLSSWESTAWYTANLTAGHWAATIGIGFDAFYNFMNSTAQGRKDIEYIKDVITNILFVDHITAYKGGGGPHWINMQDNFLGVCGGGMMTLLLAVCDEEDMRDDCEYLLENVLKSLYIAAELYFPNGGYYESVSYSDYMLENYIIALNALMTCCQTDYAIGDAPGFKDAGDYFNYLQTTDFNFGFHDGKPAYYSNYVREFIGYKYNRPEVAYMAIDQKILGNITLDIKSLFFYQKAMDSFSAAPDISSQDKDKYFYGSEAGSFRNAHGISNPVFVGFHGGWTNIPHDMLDLGQFVFESDNVTWACDLGSDSYSLADYFSTGGYRIYRKRPEGENCIVLNPQEEPNSYFGQKLGAFASLIDLEMNKPYGAKAVYDLTDAYERDALKYIRGYYFGDNRNTLIVQDELLLKGETELYWFMHTPAEIEILNNKQARLTKDGKSLIVDVYCSAEGYTLKAMEAKPLPSSPQVSGQNENTGYQKLAIYYPSVSDDVNIAVKLSPESGDYVYSPLQFVPISDWIVPEGTPVVKPAFSGIYADGKLLDNFHPGAADYVVSLPYGSTQAPIISAESDDGKIAVKQAASVDDTSIITLSVDGHKDLECRVKFEVSSLKPVTVKDELSDVIPTLNQKATLIKPINATGLTLPEPLNTPDKMLDDDFTSRATQNGAEVWFEFDLGTVHDIEGVAVSFYDGALRNFIFDLLYSEDGINFKRVFSGKSTGKTNDYEYLAIPGKVRFIRYVGYGNSGSSWNSITEFRVYK